MGCGCSNASSALSQSCKVHDAHHNPYDTAIFHSGANYPVIRQPSHWVYRGPKPIIEKGLFVWVRLTCAKIRYSRFCSLMTRKEVQELDNSTQSGPASNYAYERYA
jgi:hypothetical protein